MSAEWIEAEDDSAALDDAKRQVDGARYELWARNRLIERTLPKGD